MEASDELRLRAAREVRPKDFVRVEKIGNYDCEIREVFAEFRIKSTAAREETRQRACFDGMDVVHQRASERQLRDVGIAQNFEAGLGEIFAQGRKDRKCEDEIPDGPAADDKDFAWGLGHEDLPRRRREGLLRADFVATLCLCSISVKVFAGCANFLYCYSYSLSRFRLRLHLVASRCVVSASEHKQAEREYQQANAQADCAGDAQARFARRHPVQKVPQAPR